VFVLALEYYFVSSQGIHQAMCVPQRFHVLYEEKKNTLLKNPAH